MEVGWGGAKHSAKVSMSAFLASVCHQCWSQGLGLAQGLNFQAVARYIVYCSLFLEAGGAEG